MTVTVAILIPAKTAEAVNTTQYTSINGVTLIDKFTATNYSATTATISVNLVTYTDIAENKNVIVKQKTLQPSETYTFPELVGQALSPSSFISTIASAAGSINIRSNGRIVT